MCTINNQKLLRITLAIIITLLVSLVGCGWLSADEPGPIGDEGYFKALSYGEPIFNDIETAVFTRSGIPFDNHMSLIFTEQALDGSRYEYRISVTVPSDRPDTLNTITLDSRQIDGTGIGKRTRTYGVRVWETVDTDQTVSRFEPVNDSLNHLMLTSYDTDTTKLQGTFEFTAVRDSYYYRGSYPDHHRLPDTLHVTEGEFTTFIEDYRDQ